MIYQTSSSAHQHRGRMADGPGWMLLIVAMLVTGAAQTAAAAEPAAALQAPGFFERHGTLIWITTGMVALQAMAIGALLVERRHRRRMARKLRASEEKYRTLFDNASTAIVIMDPDLRILLANPEAARAMETLVAPASQPPSVLDFVVPEYRPMVQEYHRHRLAQPDVAPAMYELPLRDRQGQTRYVLVRARIIPGTRDTLASMLDITERKEALAALERREQELRRSEERLNKSQALALLGSWEWECATGVVTWSDETYRLFGWQPREVAVTADLCQGLVHPADRDRQQQELRATLAGGAEYQGEYRFLQRDGTERILHLQAEIVRAADGRATRMLGILQDVTETRRAETERTEMAAKVQHTQKLESLGVMAGGIAHDFNNILMTVLGNADLALMDLPPGSPSGEYIRDIIKAGQRAAALARHMLAYSGRGRLVAGPVDINAIVREMEQLAGASIGKRVQLEYRLAADLPYIEGDASQLEQVVMNLVINAAEAIGSRPGVITVTTTLKNLARRDLDGMLLGERAGLGGHVCLEVCDTGCGMDGPTVAKIFEPFFTTKFTGRGLGLAAVLGIVRSHQGAIQVTSAPGQGTTFRILLPVPQKIMAPPARTEPRTGETRLRGGTILLVEDEPAILAVERKMLETLGFKVVTATNGWDGVAVFRQMPGQFDLVLLDNTMPQMDGAETFREMRQVRADIPVILTSGYDEDQLQSEYGGWGFSGFLHKPFETAQLAALLQTLMGPPPGKASMTPVMDAAPPA